MKRLLFALQAITPIHAVLTDVKELDPEAIEFCSKRNGQEDSAPEFTKLVHESLKKFDVKNAEHFPVKCMSEEADQRNETFVPAFANSWGIWIHPLLEDVSNWTIPKEDAEIYRNKIIQHEVIHAYEQHSQRKSALDNKFKMASLLTPLSAVAATAITSKKFNRTWSISLTAGFSSGLAYILGVKAIKSRSQKLQCKLHEMEADLGAVHLGAYDKKIVEYMNEPDQDNGVHPTPREETYYTKKFLDTRKAGKNPSYKKLAWKYLWERELFKPLWQKKIN